MHRIQSSTENGQNGLDLEKGLLRHLDGLDQRHVNMFLTRDRGLTGKQLIPTRYFCNVHLVRLSMYSHAVILTEYRIHRVTKSNFLG